MAKNPFSSRFVTQTSSIDPDEPAQGVDVIGQAEFYQLLSDLRSELNCSIILVSHDLHLVMAATDKVICLNRHICCSGSPQMIIKDPHYQELFGLQGLQLVDTNIAPYVHNHDHNHHHSTIKQ